MQSRRSLPRLILAGLILSAVPAASLARQSFSMAEPVHISLPIELSSTPAKIKIRTSINRLKLSELAGDKNISVGDAIYVHLNIEPHSTIQGTYALRYPYAVTQNRPPRGDALTVSLRGVVTGKDEGTISVQYQFEDLAARKASANQMKTGSADALTLAVDHRAVGHLISMLIDGKTISIN